MADETVNARPDIPYDADEAPRPHAQPNARKWKGATPKERARDKRRHQREERDKVKAAEAAREAQKPLDDLVGLARKSDSTEFCYENPDVAMHLAQLVFAAEMDYDEVLRRLRPNLAGDEFVRVSAQLRRSEHVQHAVETLLARAGINDESRADFVRLMWQWVRGDKVELRMQAARVLSKIFFDSREVGQEAQPLKIEGLEQGMQRMLGPAVGQPPSADPTEPFVIETEASVLLPGRSE